MAEAANSDARELRSFGLLLGALVAAIFALWPLWRHHTTPLWPWMVAGALWLPALLAPTALRYLYRSWTRLGDALGRVNTLIIFSLLYAVAIIPLGLVMRLRGRDGMRRKFDRGTESYRVASHRRAAKHMERPF
jgi:saxitoxin biosynthesis operon SxtJ-like protein